MSRVLLGMSTIETIALCGFLFAMSGNHSPIFFPMQPQYSFSYGVIGNR